ncbi:pentapeptide repeat-containing protein [Hoeflea sp.]|uniref:pentapeptide repeat-containing protein n=1 Tax=Hoeflea sp. TaxID=1940281 RepID=UPI003A8FEFF2
MKWLAKSLWWWGLFSVRLFGRHYVWLFLLLFFAWMWWQGGHLLLTMSSLITGYSTRLIGDGDTGQNYEGIRNLLLGLAALLSVPFFFLRTWINERQTRTQEQGHMTDRIATAVAALGTEKQVKNTIADPDHGQQTVEITVPNLEVRIGAIYALERISQDSARDHWQVMEVLTAYLRENAKNWPKEPPPSSEDHQELYEWMDQQGPVRIDLQAIITVLARRSRARRLEEARRSHNLDLRGVHLCGADFQVQNGSADFARADLSGSALAFAELRGVDISEANLTDAYLLGAELESAKLINAKLEDADLTGAVFVAADLTGANLARADLTGAKFIMTKLTGADLESNFSVAGILALHHARYLDQAILPEGWSVAWSKVNKAWDITMPDGPYIDPRLRD